MRYQSKKELGMKNYNISADPYYNALENTKLAVAEYKHLKLPNSSKQKLKEEEFCLRLVEFIRSAKIVYVIYLCLGSLQHPE